MSEHSYGIGIDITAIEDAEVSKHWRYYHRENY